MARFTWGQRDMLAGLQLRDGHCNAGRQQLRMCGSVTEANDLVAATPAGMQEAGEAPLAPFTPAERLVL
jgi:hypothetical protein